MFFLYLGIIRVINYSLSIFRSSGLILSHPVYYNMRACAVCAPILLYTILYYDNMHRSVYRFYAGIYHKHDSIIYTCLRIIIIHTHNIIVYGRRSFYSPTEIIRAISSHLRIRLVHNHIIYRYLHFIRPRGAISCKRYLYHYYVWFRVKIFDFGNNASVCNLGRNKLWNIFFFVLLARIH